MLSESIQTLKSMSDNNFAQSLVSQYLNKGYLSDKQIFWVNKLAQEKNIKPDNNSVELGKIAQLFQSAAARLKSPKITIAVNGVTVKLSLAGQNSRYPGSIHITDGRPYGANTYYGRITNGIFWPTNSCNQAILDILGQLNGDPIATMQAYGVRSGNCGFCNKQLTDERSIVVGYGPICAKHWGLPWG